MGELFVFRYVKEFHPRMIGLTGSMQDIEKVCKVYRVYFMKTNDDEKDYLVDHSIIMVGLVLPRYSRKEYIILNFYFIVEY